MSITETNILVTAAYSLFIVVLITAYFQLQESWQKRENRKPIEAYFKQAIADLPEPPEGIQVRVHHTERGAKIKWFRTVSIAQNNVQKFLYVFLLAPAIYLFGLIPLLNLLPLLLYNSEPLTKAFLAFPLSGAVFTAVILIGTYGMTPERTYYELEISQRLWRASIDRPNSDPSTEVLELNPSHVTQLGVDVGGRVYCDVVKEQNGKERIAHIELSPMLSKTEAVWLEQVLRSLLRL